MSAYTHLSACHGKTLPRRALLRSPYASSGRTTHKASFTSPRGMHRISPHITLELSVVFMVRTPPRVMVIDAAITTYPRTR